MTDKDYVNVFKTYTGGPKNLGDPEDKSLRHVEEQMFITQLVKDRAHHLKCKEFVKKWGQCMEDNSSGLAGFLTFYTCKKQCDDMNKCLKHYYEDKDFHKECTQIYLDRRTRYRETGIIEKDPYFKKPYYESERKKEFLENFRKNKASASESSTSSSSQN